MRLPTLLAVLLGTMLPAAAAQAECLPSIKAVRAAHYAAVSVRWDKEHECFYAINVKPSKERKVMQPEQSKRHNRQTDSRPRPADTLAGAATPDTLTAADRAISETTGASVAQPTPVRWIAESVDAFEARPTRAASLPAVFVPTIKPVAAAVLPAARSVRASSLWWDALDILITIGLIIVLMWLLVRLLSWALPRKDQSNADQ